ncbi:ribose ABC transporter permease [candidate division KSB3 bacterium]|uniref:Ribose ABC transporter permease n=1 Tax=candidate division KSB3 bacterium TaxID=2044937 RepID=A0A2G6KBA5_9BACT|nr:MAG: ribose ABC transporter permease [candidate division KSB3 bacterium]
MQAQAQQQTTFGRLLKLWGSLRKYGVYLGLIGLCIILTIASSNFLTVKNILNVVRQSSIIAIMGIGMTFVILTGGIDLSVGSVLAISSVMTCYTMVTLNLPIAIGIVVGLLVGTFFGVCIGLLITRVGLPPFIATLAAMSIARGLVLVVTGGRPIFGLPKAYGWFGGGYVAFIPTPVAIMAVLYAIGIIILRKTRLGLYAYSIGGNEEASRLSGVNTNKYKVIIYGISGLAAAISGIVLASRLRSAQPLAGLTYELDVIASCVIGGISLSGGEGTLIGTLGGALVIAVLRNGLNLLNVSAYWQQVTIGVVIAVAVAIDTMRKKRQTKV